MDQFGGVPEAAIYRVSEGARIESLSRTTFGSLKISETGHLQQWVLDNPQVLGEKLLVVTRGYAGFDRSRKRLDILALDKAGKLVVVELKLEAAGTFADLQGINYAAMVSTMTMEHVGGLYSKHHEVSRVDAREAVLTFLEGDDELPDLDDEPRIIIAAGSFRGYEITSTALWLRTFGLNIKLVEIAPYKASALEVILVPRVVIPVPEAEEYMVGHEQKESAQRSNRDRAALGKHARFLDLVHNLAMKTDLPVLLESRDGKATNYLSFPALQAEKHRDHHYEWTFDGKGFTLGLHFERRGDKVWNSRMLEWFESRLDEIDDHSLPKLEVLRDTGTWRWLGYTQAGPGVAPDPDDEELAQEAVEAMRRLYARTARHILKATGDLEAEGDADEQEEIDSLNL